MVSLGFGAASDRAGRVEGWDCFMGGDVGGVMSQLPVWDQPPGIMVGY
jgi:hypothetical protein